MKTELIERYLTRQMTDEERAAFEQEMRVQPQLAEDVKIVAWTIEAIRERGQQEDAERIKRMREDMGSDSKRYATTVAAVIGGVLIVAAMTAVSVPPIYKNVIKPIIESVFSPEKEVEQAAPSQNTSSSPADSLSSTVMTDSVNASSQEEEQVVAEEPRQQEALPVQEDKTKEESTKEEKVKVEPVKATDETITEPKEKTKEDGQQTIIKNTKLDRKEMVDNTEYHLTEIDYDNKGNLVAYITLFNNRENIEYELSDMPLVNIDGDQRKAYRVTVNGESKQTFTLRRRQPVYLVIYFNGVKKNADMLTLLSVKNRNENKRCLMRNIPL